MRLYTYEELPEENRPLKSVADVRRIEDWYFIIDGDRTAAVFAAK